MKNIIFITIFTLVTFFSLSVGMDKREIVECLKWQSQASEYPQYYLLGWQVEQCNAHNIIINAPVK